MYPLHNMSIVGGSGNDEIIIESDNVEVMSGSCDKITVASGVTANIKLNNSSTVKATGSNGGAKFSIDEIGSTADVFVIEDGFNGTLKQLASEYTEESDEVNISLTKGISFTLNGTAYQYSDDGTLTYTADGVTRKFLGTDNLEGVITPKTIATTGN